MRRHRRPAAAVLGLVLIGALAPSVASGNTATIGSDLAKSTNADACTTPCVAVQQSQVGGSSPFPLTSPANGIVTEWAIRSGDNVVWAFRILRPAGPGTYTGVGTAVAPIVDPSTGQILRFGASLPIKQGDAIGITAASGDSDAGVPQANTPALLGNVIAESPTGVLDGGSATFAPLAGHELLLQATVRFCSVPSLKRLKKKTAKQQLAASDCGVKVKKRPTNKRKFRGKVLKQKTPPGTTAAPGTVVPIVIGKKT